MAQDLHPTAEAADDDARYLALAARDARFDGRFFTGVTSTGIYCRPVCRVRTPRRENCRFFTHAAQAEQAGFRPCLRCRPELAPAARTWSAEDAGPILAAQALQWLDQPDAWPGAVPTVRALAQRLGVSERHLRRVFERHLGVSPLQHLQTRRLLCAKQLLADTALPVAEVAWISGFPSARRLQAAFSTHYGLPPTALRRSDPAAPRSSGHGVRLRLGWRPPYDIAALQGFLAQRAVPGVEAVDDTHGLTLRRALALPHPRGGECLGWLQARFDAARCELVAEVSEGLLHALPAVIARLRAVFDLDADPEAIDAVLRPGFSGGAGLRVPGSFDGFELAVRAVLGQQVTVAAARTLAGRLVRAFGRPLQTPWPEVHTLFPTAAALAEADGAALGALGIVRQRQQALQALSRAVADGRLALHPGAPVEATVAQLQALPGIGAWTAQVIAMRALRWPDAFPAGDLALHAALGLRQSPQPARAAETVAQAWRPWRSYAVLRAWAGHARQPHTF